MELLLLIIIGVIVYCAITAPIKRSKHTSRCPKCGTMCKASPWGTSYQMEAKYRCPNCGHTFFERYYKLQSFNRSGGSSIRIRWNRGICNSSPVTTKEVNFYSFWRIYQQQSITQKKSRPVLCGLGGSGGLVQGVRGNDRYLGK